MKDEILNTAERLFLKYGLRSVSIDDICNELHISKKTFYAYFKQKEQLVQEMLDESYRKRAEIKQVSDDERNIIDAILENSSYFVSKQSAAKRHLAFYYDLDKYYPTLHEGFKQKMRDLDRQYLADIIKKGITQGWFREDLNIEFTSILVAETINTLIARKIEGMVMADKIKATTDVLLRIVCNEKGMKYYMEKI